MTAGANNFFGLHVDVDANGKPNTSQYVSQISAYHTTQGGWVATFSQQTGFLDSGYNFMTIEEPWISGLRQAGRGHGSRLAARRRAPGDAMIEEMATVRISEAELARDIHAVLAKVQEGVEVIVEQDHRPPWSSAAWLRGGFP